MLKSTDFILQKWILLLYGLVFWEVLFQYAMQIFQSINILTF